LLTVYVEGAVGMNEVECWIRQVKEAETGGPEFHDIP